MRSLSELLNNKFPIWAPDQMERNHAINTSIEEALGVVWFSKQAESEMLDLKKVLSPADFMALLKIAFETEIDE